MKLLKKQDPVLVILISTLLLVAAFLLLSRAANSSKGGMFLEIQLPYPSADVGSWGFIDKQGKYLIAPRFNSGGSFKNGLATVCSGKGDSCNHEITINKNGQEISPSQKRSKLPFNRPFSKQLPEGNTEYVSFNEFSEGIAVERIDIRKVTKPTNEGTGYTLHQVGETALRLIDKSGKTIKELVGTPVRGMFSEGLLPIRIGNLVGYIDRRGEIVINAQFDNGFDFRDGLACVVQRSNLGQLCGYIDKAGNLVIPYAYPNPSDFHDERALVELSRGKYGYIDKSGKIVITGHSGTRYNPFSEGVATFSDRNRAGVIDQNGRVLFSAAYKKIGSFNDGLCAARTDAGVGFIDKTGKWLLPPKYRFASDFSEGLAAVCEFDDEKLKKQVDEVAAFRKEESQRNPDDVVGFDYVDVKGHQN